MAEDAPTHVHAGSSSSGCVEEEREYGCQAEEVADARLLPREEVLEIIESLTLRFLQAIAKGEDPELHLVGNSCGKLCRGR